MASIDLGRTHKLGLDAARKQVEEIAKDLEARIGLTWRWDGQNLVRFEGSKGPAKGVKGTLSVSATDVKIAIDLPLLLKAMKPLIAGRVKEKLDSFEV